jgi:hypothetical protein
MKSLGISGWHGEVGSLPRYIVEEERLSRGDSTPLRFGHAAKSLVSFVAPDQEG